MDHFSRLIAAEEEEEEEDDDTENMGVGALLLAIDDLGKRSSRQSTSDTSSSYYEGVREALAKWSRPPSPGPTNYFCPSPTEAYLDLQPPAVDPAPEPRATRIHGHESEGATYEHIEDTVQQPAANQAAALTRPSDGTRPDWVRTPEPLPQSTPGHHAWHASDPCRLGDVEALQGKLRLPRLAWVQVDSYTEGERTWTCWRSAWPASTLNLPSAHGPSLTDDQRKRYSASIKADCLEYRLLSLAVRPTKVWVDGKRVDDVVELA